MPDSASRRGRRALPQRALVAVAHGSADPRAAAALDELMPLVARRASERGLSVPDLRVAYLGHAAPSVPQVMRTFGPDAQVTVLPLLLTAAYHSKTDIPRVLARVGTRARVTYGEPLGPHPLLLRALERRLAEADPAAPEARGHTGVVLAAAGSSDPEANATIARLAAQWQARAGWFAVRPAYASPAAAGGQGSTAAAGGRRSCAGPEPAGWWWPATCSRRACSPTGSGTPRWPRGRPGVTGAGGQLLRPGCSPTGSGHLAGRGSGRDLTGARRVGGAGRRGTGSVPGGENAGAGCSVKLGKPSGSPH